MTGLAPRSIPSSVSIRRDNEAPSEGNFVLVRFAAALAENQAPRASAPGFRPHRAAGLNDSQTPVMPLFDPKAVEG